MQLCTRVPLRRALGRVRSVVLAATVAAVALSGALTAQVAEAAPATAVGACTGSQLSARVLNAGQDPVTAYRFVVLTNHRSACRLGGFPTAFLVRAGGGTVGGPADRFALGGRTGSPSGVWLRRGGEAAVWLAITTASSSDPHCRPVRVEGVRFRLGPSGQVDAAFHGGDRTRFRDCSALGARQLAVSQYLHWPRA